LKKYAPFLLILTLLHSVTTNAQLSFTEFGARSKGLGNSNTALADDWSLFNNVGGISGAKDGVVLFGYQIIPNLEGFNVVAAGVNQPFKFGNIGMSVLKFGDELYSEQALSIAYGNKIGFVRLGFRANYNQLRIDEIGSTGAVSFDIGGIVEMLPKVTFGAFISNITMSKLDNAEGSELPVVMKLGMVYHPNEDLALYLDLYKDILHKPVYKVGLEYLVADRLFLRTGVNTEPFASYFGGGILLNRFKIDYAVSNNDFLGVSHQAAISFVFFKSDEG